MRPSRSPRFIPLTVAGICFLTAMWGGLVRLGWPWEPWLENLPKIHGPLMVSGFLGTLIGVERAVALGVRWAWTGPLLTGAAGLALLAGLPEPQGAALAACGSACLVIVFIRLLRRQSALFLGVMGLGALAWLGGNLLWLAGWKIDGVWPWWAGFLVLTIAGERLEMTRLLQPSRGSRVAFLASVILFSTGILLSAFRPGMGMQVTGVGMSTLGVWLLLQDVARRTIRQRGLPRFVAACLLAGYLWLMTAGVLAFLYGPSLPGLTYDAILHSLFLGFVFSMILGHAPVILPAVLGVAIPFQRSFYLPLALLHGSLLFRVGTDLIEWWEGRLWGGLLNAAALVFFLLNTARTGWSARPALR